MKTLKFRVYGFNGHRNRISFQPSFRWDFSRDGHTRILDVLCEDSTGTSQYVDVIITMDTELECLREMFGQLDDGLFENSRIGLVLVEVDGEWHRFGDATIEEPLTAAQIEHESRRMW